MIGKLAGTGRCESRIKLLGLRHVKINIERAGGSDGREAMNGQRSWHSSLLGGQPAPMYPCGEGGFAYSFLKAAYRQWITAQIVLGRINHRSYFFNAAPLVIFVAGKEKHAVFKRNGVAEHGAINTLQPARVGDVVANNPTTHGQKVSVLPEARLPQAGP